MKKNTLILFMVMGIFSLYGQAGLSLSIKGGAGISNLYNSEFFKDKDIMVLPAIGYSLGAEIGWNAEYYNFGVNTGAYIRQYGHAMDHLGSGQLPDIHNYYKLNAIEIPLFISSGQILDKPPLEPEVAFNPYFGITNQLLMSFTTKSGATRAIPFALNDREERINAQLLLNQSSTDGLLEYTTDDNATEIIICPILSEKSNMLSAQNKYVFQVNVNSNKLQIKSAIEKKFNVKVSNVRTMNFKGKKKQTTIRSSGNILRTTGNRKNWKKAVVTLMEGNKIDFVEGEF